MKGIVNWIFRIMVIICIIIFTVSCFGKKRPLDEERYQDYEPAATEQEMASAREQALADARERALAESDWQFNPGFVGNHQLDEETMRLVEEYIDDCLARDYNLIYYEKMILNGIQYVKIPAQDWDFVEPIVFAASYITSLYPSWGEKDAEIYLLVFYKDKRDGLIYSHDWTNLGYTIDEININNRHGLNYDYIEDLPGKRIGNSSAMVGDYNQDGYDEIVLFSYDPENPFTSIILFSMLDFTDGTKLGVGFKPMFEARIFLSLGWDDRPWELGPPIQFGTYKGTEGFVIYEHTPTGSTTFISDTISGYPDEVPEYKDQWNFYAWDAEEEQYIFIDQLAPNEIKTQWQNVKK
jgi:hypothetical protein